LDRCHVDNALGILEALKLFLSSQGAIFVVAVDMKKLERAWDLRYQGYDAARLEGKDHIDKIFQLKLSLPPKNVEGIHEYIRLLAASLPTELGALIAEGCPKNPRKIKRILNLIYFLAKGTEEEAFVPDLPLIVIWSIITVAYPELARIITNDPNSLYTVVHIIESSFIQSGRPKYNYFQFASYDLGPLEKSGKFPPHLISPIFKLGKADKNIYYFLISIARFSLLKNSTAESFSRIIFRAGLVG
jgi:hypothetical protein